MEWRPIIIDGQETNYIISEYSNIVNKTTGKPIKAVKLQGSERERVHLHINGKVGDYKIYRLAYEAFFGPIPKDMTLDHIDENIHNNHISNFQLLTASENVKKFLKNHPDHGFQKKFTDEEIHRFFKKLKYGTYYRDAAEKFGISNDHAYSLLHGRRRHDIWLQYQPFPESAYKKIEMNESDRKVIISCIIDGYGTREILNFVKLPYDQKNINIVYKLRRKIGIKDPKYFDIEFLNDVDTLILQGKTNIEIYKILEIEELTTRISDMMARRRKLLGIPNNNYKVGNKEEIEKIKKYIADGLSNNEILEKIHKERNQYYVDLFGKLRQKYKKQVEVQRLSKA